MSPGREKNTWFRGISHLALQHHLTLKTLSDIFQNALTTYQPLLSLSFPRSRTYTTNDGTLKISDVSTFDTQRRTFAGIGHITEGTGRFAGATGDVFTTGRVSEDGLSFTTDMTAQICFPN